MQSLNDCSDAAKTTPTSRFCMWVKTQPNSKKNKSQNEFVAQRGTALRITILVGSMRTLKTDAGLKWPR